jgi:hypothetical protein
MTTSVVDVNAITSGYRSNAFNAPRFGIGFVPYRRIRPYCTAKIREEMMREQAAYIAQPSFEIVSRRAILQGGAAFLALGLNPSFSMSAVMPRDQKLELFAFRAPASDYSVFAVVLPDSSARPTPRAGAVVHIHAGRESWALPIGSDGSTTGQESHAFVGPVHFSAQDPSATRLAVVFETPTNSAKPDETIDVWAEVRWRDGSRSRVGSPVVAEIVARDPSLSEVYHEITPDLDHALLQEALAFRLATMSLGAEDPEMRGHRLASMLLPDVIRYRPGAPIGFNFAGRNGRHPSDSAQAVVDTVIAGVVLPGRASEAVKLASEFPYFSTPGAIS